MDRRGATDRIPGHTPNDRMIPGRSKASSSEPFPKQPKKFIDNRDRLGLNVNRQNDQSAIRMERFLQNARGTGQSSEFESSKATSKRKKKEKSSPRRGIERTSMDSSQSKEKRDYQSVSALAKFYKTTGVEDNPIEDHANN